MCAAARQIWSEQQWSTGASQNLVIAIQLILKQWMQRRKDCFSKYLCQVAGRESPTSPVCHYCGFEEDIAAHTRMFNPTWSEQCAEVSVNIRGISLSSLLRHGWIPERLEYRKLLLYYHVIVDGGGASQPIRLNRPCRRRVAFVARIPTPSGWHSSKRPDELGSIALVM